MFCVGINLLNFTYQLRVIFQEECDKLRISRIFFIFHYSFWIEEEKLLICEIINHWTTKHSNLDGRINSSFKLCGIQLEWNCYSAKLLCKQDSTRQCL